MSKRLAPAAVLAMLCLQPPAAFAWGSAFTNAAAELADGQASLALGLTPVPAGGRAIWGEDALADQAEADVASLAAAIAASNPSASARALDSLIETATQLWQPLEAAGVLDPAGAAPGFHFRYETILAARIIADRSPASASDRRARALSDVGAAARAIARDRQDMVGRLVEADRRARDLTQGLYNDAYYAALARDLGDDLDDALEGAAGTVADLVETAWVRSGAGANAIPTRERLVIRTLSAGSGRWTGQFFLAAPAQVTARLYSPAGRWVATLEDGLLSAGFHELNAPTGPSSCPSGMYFLRLEAGRGGATAKVPLFR